MGHKTQNTKHKTQSLKIVETHQQCMMISNTMKVVTVAFCIVTPILGANPIIQRIMREEARATHGRRLALTGKKVVGGALGNHFLRRHYFSKGIPVKPSKKQKQNNKDEKMEYEFSHFRLLS